MARRPDIDPSQVVYYKAGEDEGRPTCYLIDDLLHPSFSTEGSTPQFLHFVERIRELYGPAYDAWPLRLKIESGDGSSSSGTLSSGKNQEDIVAPGLLQKVREKLNEIRLQAREERIEASGGKIPIETRDRTSMPTINESGESREDSYSSEDGDLASDSEDGSELSSDPTPTKPPSLYSILPKGMEYLGGKSNKSSPKLLSDRCAHCNRKCSDHKSVNTLIEDGSEFKNVRYCSTKCCENTQDFD
jgi:hypothetical protein